MPGYPTSLGSDPTDVSATGGFAVTKSDTVSFTKQAKALYVGGTGDVTVLMADGTTVTFVGVPGGAYLYVFCNRVNSTGTTATSIVALY